MCAFQYTLPPSAAVYYKFFSQWRMGRVKGWFWRSAWASAFGYSVCKYAFLAKPIMLGYFWRFFLLVCCADKFAREDFFSFFEPSVFTPIMRPRLCRRSVRCLLNPLRPILPCDANSSLFFMDWRFRGWGYIFRWIGEEVLCNLRLILNLATT